MNSELFFDNKKYIPARQASKLTGYSQDYVGQLCRQSKISSKRVGRTWYIEEKSILNYKTTSPEVEIVKKIEASEVIQKQSEIAKIDLKIRPSREAEIAKFAHQKALEAVKQNPPRRVRDFKMLRRVGVVASVVVLSFGFVHAASNPKVLVKAVVDVSNEISDAPYNMHAALTEVVDMYTNELSSAYLNLGNKEIASAYFAANELVSFSESPSQYISSTARSISFAEKKFIDDSVFGTINSVLAFQKETSSSIKSFFSDLPPSQSLPSQYFSTKVSNTAAAALSDAQNALNPVDHAGLITYQTVNSWLDSFVYSPMALFMDNKSGGVVVVKTPTPVPTPTETLKAPEVKPAAPTPTPPKQIAIAPAPTPTVPSPTPLVLAPTKPVTPTPQIIERIVTQVSPSDVSKSYLESRLEELSRQLQAQFSNLSFGSGGSITNVYQQIAQSQRIDNLTNTTINNPTVNGGSINNTSINNTSISNTSISATTLTTSATSTFMGRVGINTLIPMTNLDVFGSMVLSETDSYLNFGSAVGTDGYGIRDNAGTIEFKNTAGNWQSFGSGGGGGGSGTFSTTTSQVAGRLINYPTNSTDIVNIGSSSTTTGKMWFDPNTSTSFFRGSVGVGTTSPYAPLSVVGQIVGAYFTSTTTDTNTFPNASINRLVNLTSNGFVKTSGGNGTLSVDTSTYLTSVGPTNLNAADFGDFTCNGTTCSLDTSYLTTAITSLGGQTGASQTFATTSSNGGWGFSSGSNIHTLNIPTASATNVLGLLSSTDWSTFNSKVSTTRTLTAGAGLSGGGTLAADRTFAIDFTSPNTWTGLQQFQANASTTMLSVYGGAYIGSVGGNATTTILGTATSTFGAGVSATYLNVTGTSATSTFARGIDLAGGCFSIAGVCVSGSSGGGSGTVTSITLATPNSSLSLGGTNPVTTSGTINVDLNLAHANSWTGLQQFQANASTTMLSVYGGAYIGSVGGNATTTILGTATSTFGAGVQATYLNITGTSATSTFARGIDLAGGCFAIAGVCLSGSSSYGDTNVNAYIHASTTIPKTYTNNTFTGNNTFNGALTFGTLNGPLDARNGVVGATTSIGILYGGTGLTGYTSGDTLYADTNGNLAKLAKSSDGLVLKLNGGFPSWQTDLTSGGGGGATAWSTSTNSMIIYPTDTTNILVLGGNATTTTGNIFEVIGNSLFGGNVRLTGNASTTLLSASQAWFGGTATSSFNSAGALSLASALTVPNGGTGWGNIQANTLLLGNGTGQIATTSAGTNGYVLALSGGVPTWVATTTFSTGLTYTAGAVTVNSTQSIANLSNLATNGFVKTSGSNGTLSVDTTSYVPTTRTLTAGSGLTGGGTLASDRTFAIDFTSANAWTGLQQFQANASTTMFSSYGGAYIGSVGGNATTTILGTATSTFGAGISATYLNITGTSATSTFARGIDLAGGCFSIAGVCVSSGSGTSGTVTSVVAGAGFQNQGLNITTSGTLVGAFATSATPVLGNLSYYTGVGDATTPAKLGTVGTSSLAVGASLLTSGTLGAQVGGTASSLSINTGNSNTWTVLQSFNYSSSTIYSSFAIASTTNLIVNGSSFNNLLGTGLSNSSNALTVSNVPNSSLQNSTIALSDANSTLTIGGSPASLGGALTATLNLTHANTWTALQQFANASTTMFSSYGPSYFGATATSTFMSDGSLGVGTSTPFWKLNVASTSQPQIALTGGATDNIWTMRSIGGSFYLATSSPTSYATSSVSALSINSNGVLTLGSPLPVASGGTGLTSFGGTNTLLYTGSANNLSSITTANTSALVTNSSGVPAWTSGGTPSRLLRTDGTTVSFAQAVLTTDVTGVLPLANGGTNATSFAANSIITSNAAGTALIATTSQLTVGSLIATTTSTSQIWGNVGISTSTPWAQFAINPIAGQASNAFLVGSSTATSFVVSNAASVGIGTSTPSSTSRLDIRGKGTSDSTSTLHLTDSNGVSMLTAWDSGVIGINANTYNSGAALIVLAPGAVYTNPNRANILTVESADGEDGIGVVGNSNVEVNLAVSNSGGGIGYAGTSSNNDFYLFSNNTQQVVITKTGLIGIATTSALYALNSYSATAPQLALSAGAGITQWAFRNAGGTFYLSTTTVQGNATTSISALEVASTGFGTTTLRGLNISGQATTTSNVGYNITTGCFAVSGNCMGTTNGTVTSINVSGGSTGLTTSGGAVTSSGTITLAGTLDADNGGTGWGNIQANSILLGNGTGQLATTSAGTNGYVLALSGGVPTWVATTTFSTGLTYTAGAVTVNSTQSIANLSNLATNGFVKTSGGNGTLSVDTTSYTPTTRTLTASTGLSGGGTLAADRSFSIDYSVASTWTALHQFQANASTTMLSVYGGAYIGSVGGNATTTILGTATSTFGAGISATYLNITGTSATSTFARGIDLAQGCFSIAGTCISGSSSGGGSGTVNSGTLNRLAYYSGVTTLDSSALLAINPTAGWFGVGTTTQHWLTQLSSSTAPQLALGDDVNSQWTFRNAGGNFYLSTSSPTTFATTSISALEISGTGFGTTTLRGLNISGLATSTSNVGYNITSGCFAISGTCLSTSGGSGSPGGSDTQVQFNNSSAFGGSANFTFNNASSRLTVSYASTTALSVSSSLAITGGRVDYSSTAATSTIKSNSPFAWTLATSTGANPIFNVDTTTGSEVVDIGAKGGSSVIIGGVGQASNLIFEENSTIKGQTGGRTLTFGGSGDIINFSVNTGFSSSTPWRTLSVGGTVAFNGLTSSATGNALCITTTKDVTDAGGGTCTPSSIRFKENVETLPFNTALDEFNRMRVVSYDYKYGSYSPEDGPRSVGLIAEEVEKIDSRLVDYGYDGQPLTLHFERITGLSVQAIQELHLDITATTTLAADGTTPTLLGRIFNSMKSLGVEITSAYTRITSLFVGEVHVENKLCVDEVCINKDQLKALLLQAQNASASTGSGSSSGGSGGGSGGGSATTTPEIIPTDTNAPVITVVAPNPTTISVGATYSDLGATVTDTNADGSTNNNLGLHFNVNGTDVTDILLDTSTSTTHTIIYSAVDGSGNWGYATRTVEVVPQQ